MATINAPLHPETEGLFGDKLIGRMKRGAYLINTANHAAPRDDTAHLVAVRTGQARSGI